MNSDEVGAARRPAWAVWHKAEKQYFAFPDDQNSEEVLVSTPEEAVLFPNKERASDFCLVASQVVRGRWIPQRVSVTRARAFRSFAKNLGVSIDSQSESFQRDMEEMCEAAKMMNAFGEQISGDDEFSVMCWELGLEVLGPAERQKIAERGLAAEGDFSKLIELNEIILRAGIEKLRDNYARTLLKRGAQFITLVGELGVRNIESRRVACMESGLFPFPKCLALGLVSRDEVTAMKTFAREQSEAGVQTSPELVFMLSLALGLQQADPTQFKALLLEAEKEDCSEPIAHLSDPIIRCGFQTMRKRIAMLFL